MIFHVWCKEGYRFVAEKTREGMQNSENWEYGILEGVKEKQRESRFPYVREKQMRRIFS
jgi:hypothetical protein